MGLTNFPNGIKASPVVGAGTMFGAQGSVYFVDPVDGNNGYDGVSPTSAKKTVKAAYDLCADGKNDVVYFLSNGSSGAGTADVLTEAITWSKHRTHLIGVCAPQILGQRARINTVTLMTPMFTLSGRGCYIANIQFSNNGTDATSAAVCMYVSGDNSSFENCQFQGLGALAVVDNSHRSLVINDADDCYFKNCTIGSDTMDYGTATSYVMEFAGTECARNVFEDCLFLGGGSANAFFVGMGNATTTSMQLFKNCVFWNNTLGSMDEMTYAFSVTGSNGVVILHNTSITGAADVADNPGNIVSNLPVPASATDAGLSIVVTKT